MVKQDIKDKESKIKQIDNSIIMLMDLANMSRNKNLGIRKSFSESFLKDVKQVISEQIND